MALTTIDGRDFQSEADLRDYVRDLDREYAGEVMPREARDRWNEANGILDELRARDDRIAELFHRGNVEGPNDTFQPGRPGPDRFDQRPAQVKAAQSAGLRAIERNSDALTAAAGDELDELLRERDELGIGAKYLDAVGDDCYATAFMKVLRYGQYANLHMTPEEQQAVMRVSQVTDERDYYENGRARAMSLTTTSGGFAVPFVLDPSVIRTSSGAINPYRSIANVVSISVDEWRGVSSTGITATFQAEASAVTDASPTLAQPLVSTEMARAFVPFSIEIGMDWGNFQQEMAGLFADSKDVLEAAKFATGTGTNEPFGVITGATTVSRSPLASPYSRSRGGWGRASR